MFRKISVIGLGYVGLPVAVAFGKISTVIGFDTDEIRISQLQSSIDSTREVPQEDLKIADIIFTTDIKYLSNADFHIVAVPTPINEAKQPDLSPLRCASEIVGGILKPKDIVVFESTVYPGCTEEVCVPILEKFSGLKLVSSNNHLKNNLLASESFEINKNIQKHSNTKFSIISNFDNKNKISTNLHNFDKRDLEENIKNSATNKNSNNGFFIGYSPERINPGDTEHTFTKTKKLVSGSTPETTKTISEVYGSVVEAGTHCVSSIKVAEAAKVIENAQRDINIAFVNELSLIFNSLNIDTKEVLEAAGTKWNFLNFQPGLVGGHCIGIDSYYLSYIAETAGYHPQIILAGRRINDSMGTFIAQKTIKTMANIGVSTIGAKVSLLGLTFKENCQDLRNSKVLDVIHELECFGCQVAVHDPHCNPEVALKEYGITLLKENDLRPANAVVIAVKHKAYTIWSVEQWRNLVVSNGILVDVKGVLSKDIVEELGNLVWKL